MKTLKLLTFGISCAVAMAGCQQFKKGDGGMLYKIHKDADGPTLKEGDFMEVRAVQKTESDSIMYSSYELDQPTFLPMQKMNFKGDLYSGLAMLSEGDSATIKLNIDTMVSKGMPKPPVKGKYMVYTLKIEKVIPKGKKNDQQFTMEVQAYITKQRAKWKAAEAGKIEKYVKDKDLKVQSTSTGLKYEVDKKGEGNTLALRGDTVQANYAVYLLNGKLMDTNLPDKAKDAVSYQPQAMRKYEPIKFPVGMGLSVPGFDEGLMLFPKGTKARIIVPSSLAYGENGSQQIGPFTPLLFELEILNIIKGKPVVIPPSAMVTPATPQK